MADTLSALRSLMASHSPPLDALVVSSEDYRQVLLSLFLFQFFAIKNFASSNLEI